MELLCDPHRHACEHHELQHNQYRSNNQIRKPMDAVSFCGVYGYERYVDDYAGRVDSYFFPNQSDGRKCV